MKDQYFGDFGDYQKISLLQDLQNEDLKVLVYWLKTKDDGSTDGKHITYLEKSELWRSFAPDIFDYLNEKIRSDKRLLTHIEKSPHTSKVQFVNDYIEDLEMRDKVLEKIAGSSVDVILFDPDNGIEVASTNKKNVHKYVTWQEIGRVFESGKSVIIYQHFSRSNREQFIKDKVHEIHNRVEAPVVSIQVRHSVYFFLIQPKHEAFLRKALVEFTKRWQHFAILR